MPLHSCLLDVLACLWPIILQVATPEPPFRLEQSGVGTMSSVASFPYELEGVGQKSHAVHPWWRCWVGGGSAGAAILGLKEIESVRTVLPCSGALPGKPAFQEGRKAGVPSAEPGVLTQAARHWAAAQPHVSTPSEELRRSQKASCLALQPQILWAELPTPYTPS